MMRWFPLFIVVLLMLVALGNLRCESFSLQQRRLSYEACLELVKEGKATMPDCSVVWQEKRP